MNFYQCMDAHPWHFVSWIVVALLGGFTIGVNSAHRAWKKHYEHWMALADQLDKENTSLLRDLAQVQKAMRPR